MALNDKAIEFMELSNFQAYSDGCIFCKHSTSNFPDMIACSYLIALDPDATVNAWSICDKFKDGGLD